MVKRRGRYTQQRTTMLTGSTADGKLAPSGGSASGPLVRLLERLPQPAPEKHDLQQLDEQHGESREPGPCGSQGAVEIQQLRGTPRMLRAAAASPDLVATGGAGLFYCFATK